MRGVNPVASHVDSAVAKLKEVETRAQNFHASSQNQTKAPPSNKTIRLQNVQYDANKVLFKEGRLIHRTEQEMKTHTSYLVFAVLPRDWSEEDEARERKREATGKMARLQNDMPKSQRQLKKESKLRKKINKARREGTAKDEEGGGEPDNADDGLEEEGGGEVDS